MSRDLAASSLGGLTGADPRLLLQVHATQAAFPPALVAKIFGISRIAESDHEAAVAGRLIVEAHGGEVTIDPEGDGRCGFSIRLDSARDDGVRRGVTPVALLTHSTFPVRIASVCATPPATDARLAPREALLPSAARALRDTSRAPRFALTQPRESVVAEITVLPVQETLWP